jgi:hypothetical protein
VAYIVCRRNGVTPASETYLTNYVRDNMTVDDIDVYQVMRASGQVEALLGLAEHSKLNSKGRKPAEGSDNEMGIYSDYVNSGVAGDLEDLTKERKRQLRRIGELRGRDVLVVAADMGKQAPGVTTAISFEDRLPISGQLSNRQALRSRRGASYRLISLLPGQRWRIVTWNVRGFEGASELGIEVITERSGLSAPSCAAREWSFDEQSTWRQEGQNVSQSPLVTTNERLWPPTSAVQWDLTPSYGLEHGRMPHSHSSI